MIISKHNAMLEDRTKKLERKIDELSQRMKEVEKVLYLADIIEILDLSGTVKLSDLDPWGSSEHIPYKINKVKK